MPYAITCPHCSKSLRAPDKALGKTMPCPACKQPIVLPKNPEGKAHSAPTQPTTPTGPHIDVMCPNCTADVKVPQDAAGQTTKCPNCSMQFPVPASTAEVDTDEEVVTQHTPPFQPTNDDQPDFQTEPVAVDTPLDDDHSPENHSHEPTADGHLVFEGALTPRVRLLQGESEVDRYACTFLDTGWWKWMLGHRDRMVLTTHRIILFQQRTVFFLLQSNFLEVYWLPNILAAHVYKRFNWIRMGAGVGLATTIGYALASSIHWIIGLVVALALIVLFFLTSFENLLLATVNGGNWFGIGISRMRSSESQNFLNKLFDQIHRQTERAPAKGTT